MLDTGLGSAVELSEAISELTADQSVKLIRELCAQLTEEGTSFHGNIWPGSVRIEDGKAVLGEGSDAPVAGRNAGQVEYLSPEYFWVSDGTGASDVYSLGLLLYAGCNNGYLPFQPKGGALTDRDRSGALRKRMRGEEIPVPSGVSEELGAVLTKALSYEPEDRYAGPKELLMALNGTDEAMSAVGTALSETGPEIHETAPDAEIAAATVGATAAAGTAVTAAAQNKSGKSGKKGKKGKNAGKSAPAVKDELAVKEEPAAKAEPAAEEPAAKAEPEAEEEPSAQEEPAERMDAETASAPAKSYTVQKDFEKTKKSKKSQTTTAAAASRTKKKKTSPVIPILCVAAIAVIGGGIWYALNHKAPTPSATLDPEDLAVTEPVVVLPVESPDATEAPAPTEDDVHTTKLVDLIEDEQDDQEQDEDGEDGEPAVGSPSIDGMDVTAESGTVYVTGSGVNLRTGPGTSYQVAKTLSRGTKLALTGTVNGWSQVQYEGEEYYVSSALISTENPKGEDAETLESTDSTAAAETASPSATGTGTSTTAASTGSKTTGAAGEVSVGTGTLRVTSDANIRSGPDTSYDKLGEAKAGTTLTATGVVDGKWYRISYDGKEGYVNRKMVSVTDFSALTEKSGTLEVVADANIRSGPGTGYDKLGEIKAGNTLTMTGCTESNWYQVSYEGKTGYVAGNLVKEA